MVRTAALEELWHSNDASHSCIRAKRRACMDWGNAPLVRSILFQWHRYSTVCRTQSASCQWCYWWLIDLIWFDLRACICPVICMRACCILFDQTKQKQHRRPRTSWQINQINYTNTVCALTFHNSLNSSINVSSILRNRKLQMQYLIHSCFSFHPQIALIKVGVY